MSSTKFTKKKSSLTAIRELLLSIDTSLLNDRRIPLYLLCLGTCMLMLRQRHYMHISSLLILCPVDIIRHLCFRIELHAFKDVLHKLLIAYTVNQMSAMEILWLLIQSPCRELLPVSKHAKNHIFCYPVQEQFAGTRILLTCTSA